MSGDGSDATEGLDTFWSWRERDDTSLPLLLRAHRERGLRAAQPRSRGRGRRRRAFASPVVERHSCPRPLLITVVRSIPTRPPRWMPAPAAAWPVGRDAVAFSSPGVRRDDRSGEPTAGRQRRDADPPRGPHDRGRIRSRSRPRGHASISSRGGSRSTSPLSPHDEPGRVVEGPAGTAVFVALAACAQRGRVTIEHGHGRHRGTTPTICSAPRGLAYDAATQLVHVACAGKASFASRSPASATPKRAASRSTTICGTSSSAEATSS